MKGLIHPREGGPGRGASDWVCTLSQHAFVVTHTQYKPRRSELQAASNHLSKVPFCRSVIQSSLFSIANLLVGKMPTTFVRIKDNKLTIAALDESSGNIRWQWKSGPGTRTFVGF